MNKVNKFRVIPFVGKPYNEYLGGRLRDRMGRFAKERAEQGFSFIQRFESWSWMMAKKWLLYPTLLAGVLTVALYVSAGYALNKYAAAKEPVYKDKIVFVKDETLSPVMVRIAKCESGGHQYDKDGQVIRGKLVRDDVGMFQINEKNWGAQARVLGLNIYDETDNKKMALWIYENIGTAPWSASARCWYSGK